MNPKNLLILVLDVVVTIIALVVLFVLYQFDVLEGNVAIGIGAAIFLISAIIRSIVYNRNAKDEEEDF